MIAVGRCSRSRMRSRSRNESGGVDRAGSRLRSACRVSTVSPKLWNCGITPEHARRDSLNPDPLLALLGCWRACCRAVSMTPFGRAAGPRGVEDYGQVVLADPRRPPRLGRSGKVQILQLHKVLDPRRLSHGFEKWARREDDVGPAVVDDKLKFFGLEDVVEGHERPAEHPRREGGNGGPGPGGEHDADGPGAALPLDEIGKVEGADHEFDGPARALVVDHRHPPGVGE
jgi:hypothetical protein